MKEEKKKRGEEVKGGGAGRYKRSDSHHLSEDKWKCLEEEKDE